MKNKKRTNNAIMAFKTLPQIFSLIYSNDKKYLLIMLLEVVAFSIDKYPSLLIMRYTIDALTNNIQYSSYVSSIIPLIAIMLILKMIRVMVNTSRPCRDQVITENLFNVFFSQCMRMEFQTLESKEMQDKKELAKYIANGKIAAVGWYFVEMSSSLIALIIATIFILQINIFILVLVVFGVIFKAFWVKKNSDETVPITEKQVLDNRYLSYLYGVGLDYDYIKEFRIFNYKKSIYGKINEWKNKCYKNDNNLSRCNLLYAVALDMEDFMIKMISFILAGLSCLKAAITISDFTFIIGLVNDYTSYSNSFMSSCKKYLEASAYIEHYTEFMRYGDISSSKNKTDKKLSEGTHNSAHVIEFKNVYFKYPYSDNYALKNINLKFYTPMKISLVGRNGAGKSTLIKLLLRLYKPDEGEISIDGVSIYKYTMEEYSMLFSSVFQDFVLFAFSVTDNITSFAININQKYFIDVVKETGVEEFICNYIKQYDTFFSNEYSNDGVAFSGGEQQKIALARSIYKKDAMFFILDEPSSTYDADAEYQLYRKYEKILIDKGSIFISHRLSSCKLSDYIILLNDGIIIEEGTHADLMAQESQYKRMFELQANQYNWKGDNNE